MIPALATLLFFAITPVFANRAAHLLGSLRANAARLIVAALVLGLWAHAFGRALGGIAMPWFVLGGIVGFGVGGVAMFNSLPRIGSTLSTLIVQCLSAVTAALVEWLWLGTVLTAVQVGCAALTLAGVIVGLMPRSLPRPSSPDWRAGVAWAVLSAVGQGVGAVISRKAFAVAAAAADLTDPGSATYQRVLGGLLVAALAVALAAWPPAGSARRGASSGVHQPPAGPPRPLRPPRELSHVAIATPESTARRRRGETIGRQLQIAWPWVLANAATGPILGVTFYQWALRSTPAGIVQPIVAAAPLLTIPFAMLLEGTRPRATYYFGAVLAIAGVSGLMTVR